jgi:putative nucleotidyltransferase with HDIG domain
MSSAVKAPARVRAYVVFVVVLAIATVVASAYVDRFGTLSYPHDLLGLATFLAVGLGLELSHHKLVMGSVTGSIAFIVYLPAAVVFGPTWCAVIAAISVGVAQVAARKSLLKTVFNVGQHILALVLGAEAYIRLGGPVHPSSFDHVPLPFFGLVATYFVVNSSAVSGVVALAEKRQFSEVWLRNTWGLVTYDLIASAFGLGVAWVYLKMGFSGMAAVVLPILFLRHTYHVNLQLQATYRELLELMVKSVEARDPYTSGHSQRVSELARVLAREMGLHLREVDNIATAALLHDIGKIYEEFAPILRKEGKLTPEEREIMHTHPARSADLVATISNLRGYVQKCVRHHHENFDGTGYPDGIAGEEIPIGARIILVADTTDAMTTDRPYRKALPYERVVEELEMYSNTQFDPRVVSAFKRSATTRRLIGGDRKPQLAPAYPRVERREKLVAH